MRSGFMHLMVVLLALAALPSAGALEADVLTVSEGVLYVDVPSDFVVTDQSIDTNTSGILLQMVEVDTPGAPWEGKAALFVMDWYDQYAKLLDPVATSEFLVRVIISEFEAEGAQEIGSWSATAATGENVTVHTLNTTDPELAVYGGTFDLAFWGVDKSRYLGIATTYDENTTRQMIGSMAVEV